MVDVSASEFKFAVRTNGRIPAGLVELKLANRGTMDHEALLVRLHPGVSLARFEGGHGGWLRLNLSPGRYAAICFVPDDAPPHMPHAAVGMVVAFTVTK